MFPLSMGIDFPQFNKIIKFNKISSANMLFLRLHILGL